MAPAQVSSVRLTTKEKIKLRKPVVEKMRRDRINSSIEKLKALLENELKANQPSSKLEKADILEMAVFYLRENLHPAKSFNAASPGLNYAEGFTKCLQETLRFLSAHESLRDSRHKLLSLFHGTERWADREVTILSPAVASSCPVAPEHVGANEQMKLWRPW